MEAVFDLSGTTAMITLGGNLTVSSASQLKSLLLQGLEQAETWSFRFMTSVTLISRLSSFCAQHIACRSGSTSGFCSGGIFPIHSGMQLPGRVRPACRMCSGQPEKLHLGLHLKNSR